jgi:gliding motility-associated-like protein
MKEVILTLFILLSFHTINNAQRDTLFWFVAPNITSGHGEGPMMLRFSSFEKEAKVFIDQPANPLFNPISLTVPAKGVISFNLTNHPNFQMNFPPNQILPYGLRIRSNEEIFVYYESNRRLNPDIFSLKGRNALGHDFWIPIQNAYATGPDYNPTPSAGFDIVATENNTEVRVIPSDNAVGHQAGVPFTVVLNRGQTYSVIAQSGAVNAKLSGSKISANKPIAVTIKDDSSSGPGSCRDLNGDQLVPVSVLGFEYVLVRGFLNPFDHVFVLATEDNTSILINGNLKATLNTGQMYSGTFNDDAIYIESDHPIYVSHLSGYGCEVGSAILPRVDCTGSKRVSFVRSSAEDFFLILFTKAGNEDSFLLNGDSTYITSALFKDVPATNGKFKFARISLNTSQIPVEMSSSVENSRGVFHMGLINGSRSGGTRYGYFSDFVSFSVEATGPPDQICEGDSISAIASFFPDATYMWTGPENFSAFTSSWTLSNASISQRGWYTVTSEIDGCPASSDSVLINITPIPVIEEFEYTNSICEGENLSFDVILDESQSVNWSGPNGFSSNAPTINIDSTSEGDSGIYSFYISEGTCSSDTINLDVNVFPNFYVEENLTSCDSFLWLSNGEVYQESGNYVVYNQTSNGCDSISTLQLTINKTTSSYHAVTACDIFSWNNETYTDGGIYTYQTVNSKGCDSIATLHLTVNKSNSSEQSVTACDIFSWNNETYTDGGIYTYQTVNSKGCDSIATLQLTINKSTGSFDTAVYCKQYFWNGSTYKESGLYFFHTVNSAGCDSTATLQLEIKNNDIYAPNIFTPNNDGLNDCFAITTNTTTDIVSYRISIYDRWGNQVFTSFSADDCWDGTVNGKSCTEGVYVFILELEDHICGINRISGDVTLIR